jgi:hypothetical protein
MKIPKKIQIAGRTYDIEYDKSLNQSTLSWATIHPDKQKIIMQSNVDGNERSKESVEISFLHEVIHGVSKAMGRNDLYRDEAYTEQMSELLYQVINQIGDIK